MRKGITARFAKLTWLTLVLLLTGIPAGGIASKLPANLLISPQRQSAPRNSGGKEFPTNLHLSL